MFFCGTCQAFFTLKRNLTRHISEKHLFRKFWYCAMTDCEKKCTRRYNLVNHLEKVHRLSRKQALLTANNQPFRPYKGGHANTTDGEEDTLVQIIAEIENCTTRPNTEMQNRTIEQFDVHMFDDNIYGNAAWNVIPSISKTSVKLYDNGADAEEDGQDDNYNVKEKSIASGSSFNHGDSYRRDSCIDYRKYGVNADYCSDNAGWFYYDNYNIEEGNNDSLGHHGGLYHTDSHTDSNYSEPGNVVIINDTDDEALRNETINLNRRTEIVVLTFRRDAIFDTSGNVIYQTKSVDTDYYQYINK